MKFLYFLIPFCLLFSICSFAQSPKISILDSGHNVSLRGLSVVSDKVLWCSGSNGTVARSVDGGKTIEWMTLAGYEKRDFRDIEAFDANTAVIMSIAEPAIILKTIDGGKTWEKIFEDDTKGMFLDAMSFDKNGNGVVIGDPIAGKIFLAVTNDFGSNWKKESIIFTAEKGESFFASSGTNIHLFNGKGTPYLFVSGGMMSHLFYRNRKIPLPLMKGKESTGANSIAVWGNKGIVVGGDFANDKRADSNCVLFSLDKNVEVSTPAVAPSGYKSCVFYIKRKKVISCGTSGVDISVDGGRHWENISRQRFHVVQKAKNGKTVYLAGAEGKIAKWCL